MIVFFMHKTSDGMHISDWNSDVCSADLFTIQRTVLSLWIVLSNEIVPRKNKQCGPTEGAPKSCCPSGMPLRHWKEGGSYLSCFPCPPAPGALSRLRGKLLE